MVNRFATLGPVLSLAGILILASGCADGLSTAPEASLLPASAADAPALHGQPSFQRSPNEHACWGQASRVFAQMGAMGEHSSGFETPRLGLRNLARALHEAGGLEDDSMQALGAFVATELGLSIEACQ